MNQWVAQYGYVLVAVFLMVEATGVPIPGETALVTAAALAGRGTLSIVGVVIAACVGTIGGGHLGYWIGGRAGARIVAKHGRWLGLNEQRLAKTHKFFEQYGAKTVALGRFVAFLRSFLGIFAGVSGMRFGTFALYNAVGGVVWVLTFSVLGYGFGRNLPRLIHYIGRVSLLVALLIALAAGLVFFWRWFNRNWATIVGWLDARYERAVNSARLRALPGMSEAAEHPVRLARRFMSARYAQRRYLALHLVVGFAASLVVIGLFAAITEGLVESSPLTRFDVTVAARLRASASPVALDVFGVLSALGGRGPMTLLLVAGAAFYALQRRGLQAAGWCAAFIGGSLLDAALRLVVKRSELPFANVLLADWGTGLASEHALGVVIGCGMLGYLSYAFVRSPASRTIVAAGAILLTAAITISRLYLGQQFVSDATAGVAAGLVWLASCISGIEIARRRRWRGGLEGGAAGG